MLLLLFWCHSFLTLVLFFFSSISSFFLLCSITLSFSICSCACVCVCLCVYGCFLMFRNVIQAFAYISSWSYKCALNFPFSAYIPYSTHTYCFFLCFSCCVLLNIWTFGKVQNSMDSHKYGCWNWARARCVCVCVPTVPFLDGTQSSYSKYQIHIIF